MSLEDLGNIGEFVAAVALVVSLIYLAVQIRHNTRHRSDLWNSSSQGYALGSPRSLFRSAVVRDEISTPYDLPHFAEICADFKMVS